MIELKYKKEFSGSRRKEAQSFCDSADPAVKPEESCCPGTPRNKRQWITGTLMTGAGLIPRVSTDLSLNDCINRRLLDIEYTLQSLIFDKVNRVRIIAENLLREISLFDRQAYFCYSFQNFTNDG